MKKPNKYLTILFISTMIYAVYNLAAPSGKKNREPKPGEATESPTGEFELANAFREKSGSVKNNYKKEKQKMLPWGKDPFLFPEGMDPYHKMKKVSPKKVADRPVKDINTGRYHLLSLKITSILISEDQRAATINRAPYVVTIGDRIGDVQVIDILQDRVIFAKHGKTQEIFLSSQLK